MTGIYLIKNKINGNCYIGQSIDIQKRWIDHKTPSKKNRGTVLGRALNKYGSGSFDFIVLEECGAEELNGREMYYIAKLKPAYNMNQGGSGNKGHRLTREAKQHLSSVSKKQWSAKTEEERQKIIANNLTGPRKGHSVKPETRKKLRECALKQFQGGMPEEHKKKISNALKGKAHGYASRKCQVEQIDKDTGKIISLFQTIKEASARVGCHPSNITSVCKGRQKTAAGYRWAYHPSSVEAIPKGSRAGDELPPEVRSDSKEPKR